MRSLDLLIDKRIRTMKITKTQLIKIIKEEISDTLNESSSFEASGDADGVYVGGKRVGGVDYDPEEDEEESDLIKAINALPKELTKELTQHMTKINREFHKGLLILLRQWAAQILRSKQKTRSSPEKN